MPAFPRRLTTGLLLGCCLLLSARVPAMDNLTVLTWEAFVSPKVLKTFKNREQINVTLIEFTTEDEREQLLRKRGAEIDIVVADTTWTGEYKRRGIIEKLDAKRLPGLRHTMSRWRYDPDYAVPYLWGHTGIAWRTDLVATPPATYRDLFRLAAANPGKVSLLDAPHEALRAALYAFGKAPYRMEGAAGVAAADALLQPQLKDMALVGSDLGDDSPWVTGKVIAGQAFNGDIAYLRDTYKLPLAFAIPSPGCMIFQEQMMVMKTAKHRDAAYRFLNLINEPKYAARNATDVRYATPNALAVGELPEEFRKDPVIRPVFDGLDGCYFYGTLDAQTTSALERVKLRH